MLTILLAFATYCTIVVTFTASVVLLTDAVQIGDLYMYMTWKRILNIHKWACSAAEVGITGFQGNGQKKIAFFKNHNIEYEPLQIKK